MFTQRMWFLKGSYLPAILGVLLVTVFASSPAQAARSVAAAKVTTAPVLDGSGNDGVWNSAGAITVNDGRSGADITIKAVYTGDSIFFLVRYPDSVEDRLHKPWVWNKDMEVYMIGTQREDTFVFKWNMMAKEVDLSNFSDDNYTADIWYWKANRTNPAGYADDKSQILSYETGKKATEITSKSGKKRYLMRLGDKGTSAQKKRILTSYKGDIKDQYESREPKGSRADVRAKGIWKDGFWTIEFGRKLNTGHSDDVQFNVDSAKKYQFGISIFSLYGEPVDKKSNELYGKGRISEKLYLVFK